MEQSFVLGTKRIVIPDYPDAFNPSIIKWREKNLMSFRTRDHKTGKATLVGFVWLDDNFDPMGPATLLHIPSNYIQDPRLFCLEGSLYMAYSDLFPENEGSSRKMCLTQIFSDGHSFYATNPEFLLYFEADKKRKFEKNWAPFIYNDCLLLSYTLFPHRVFFPLIDEKKCVTVDITTSAKNPWKWGSIRGGTPTLLVDGQYLGFFHSSINMSSENSEGKEMPHYFMGAYTFSSDPPFKITNISPEPIVGPHFYTKTNHQTWKPLKVVFPSGFIFDKKNIWISYGKQDHECWIVKLDKKGLLNSLKPIISGE